jgi:hypothetical protein
MWPHFTSSGRTKHDDLFRLRNLYNAANDLVQHYLLNLIGQLIFSSHRSSLLYSISNHIAKNNDCKPAITLDIQASALTGGMLPSKISHL